MAIKELIEKHTAALDRLDHAAEEEFDLADQAEIEAARALCAYRCVTIDEERERLSYILGNEAIMISLARDYAPLLLNAVKP